MPISLQLIVTACTRRPRAARDAAVYSNIGINKLDSMLRLHNCPFGLFAGAKSLNSTFVAQWQFEGKFLLRK